MRGKPVWFRRYRNWVNERKHRSNSGSFCLVNAFALLRFKLGALRGYRLNGLAEHHKIL